MKFLRYLFSICIITLCVASLYSCSKKTNNMVVPQASLDTSKKYLALGDSYTIGQSVLPLERFPNQVVSLLRAAHYKVADPDIIATTGWTTGDLIRSLNNNTPGNNYSFVTLLIGVNNQYQGRGLTEYASEFTLLLNRAIQYAGNVKKHVIVISIPDYSVTPFAANSDTARIAREIDAFNQVNKDISTQMGITWLNITPISREARTNPSLVASDGLHPSATQYSRWSALLVPLIEQTF